MSDEPQNPVSVIASTFNRLKTKSFGMQFGEQAVIDLRAEGWMFTRVEDAETQEDDDERALLGEDGE